jgi:hypothetical protein
VNTLKCEEDGYRPYEALKVFSLIPIEDYSSAGGKEGVYSLLSCFQGCGF